MGVCLRFSQPNINSSQLKIMKCFNLSSVAAFGRPTYIGRPTFQSFERPTHFGRSTSHMQDGTRGVQNVYIFSRRPSHFGRLTLWTSDTSLSSLFT